ncbi:MAG: hypothetical protein ACRC38_08535 [Plesiomonas sp.]
MILLFECLLQLLALIFLRGNFGFLLSDILHHPLQRLFGFRRGKGERRPQQQADTECADKLFSKKYAVFYLHMKIISR